MSYYNVNCTVSSRNCVSGCCTSGGLCANTSSTCTYTYSDYYTNSTKYYYPGYANSMCGTLYKNCVSGCCNLNGGCANT